MSTTNTKPRATALGTLLAATIVLAAPVSAGTMIVSYDEPTLDRWMYAFNPFPGTRPSSSTFGAFTNPAFDNRDGQMLIGFDTAAEIPTGLELSRYQIVAARVTVQNDDDLGYVYDDTLDPYNIFLALADKDYLEDEDPGQPVEIWGTGFRAGYTALTFFEDSPFTDLPDPLGQMIRNAYPLSYDEKGGAIDVSMSADQQFDPVPWAFGIIDGLAPGSLVPEDSETVFDIDVDDANIQGYFQQSLQDGMLDFCITSFTLVEPFKGDFPSFYNKENALVLFGVVSAARLELTVIVGEAPVPGDTNGDGIVDFDDLLAVIIAWGPCDGCPEDLDESGEVDFQDLLIVIVNWS